MNHPDTLGLRLRLYRTMRGLSRRQLGQLSGLHHQTIGFIESDERDPTTRTLRSLAEALGITCAQLLGEQALFDDSTANNERALHVHTS